MDANNLPSVQDEQTGKPLTDAENTELSTPSLETVEPDSNEKIDEESSLQAKTITDENAPIDDSLELNEQAEDVIESDNIADSDSSETALTIDYQLLNKEELVLTAEKLLKEKNIEALKNDFDIIKIQFYKKFKAENEKLYAQFIEEGGIAEDFKPQGSPLEEKLKEVFKQYRDLRNDFIKKIEIQKQENLKTKEAIIEEIKELTGKNESLNDTFHQFRELQKKWRSIGPVPQSEVNNLWENYNHHVEKFYDYIKINKELRDLDLKKNFEAKMEICEKAEALLMEPSVIKAFRQLQEFHNKWREIGPVPNELRTDIWNRFKDITGRINKIHQEYFDNQKDARENNLKAKTELCEKAEILAQAAPESMKEWDKLSEELIELQNVWKSIGFAPKKDNNTIYQRFRLACDNFFAKKRDFYSKIKDEQNNNLQIKLDLCVQAEALKDSTEWKKSTEDLINIQKKWKDTGPVPRRLSDQIWKRFRMACDTFFNNKSAHFSTVDNKYEENLSLKIALIEEIENYQQLEKVEDNFEKLKDFQRRWSEIGYVPLKQKEDIQTRYRKALDKLFDSLKLDDNKRKMIKFKEKIEHMPHNRKGEIKMDRERDKLIIRLKKLESDIVLWENNIGFFAKSKTAEAMINEVQSRIDSAKAEIKSLEEKIKLIDSLPAE